jgi:hypothetical protein
MTRVTRMNTAKERTAHAILVSDALANRLLESLVGSGPVNPLCNLIRAGMTEADALQFRDSLDDATTQDGGKLILERIAHFAASCARRAVQGGGEYEQA